MLGVKNSLSSYFFAANLLITQRLNISMEKIASLKNRKHFSNKKRTKQKTRKQQE